MPIALLNLDGWSAIFGVIVSALTVLTTYAIKRYTSRTRERTEQAKRESMHVDDSLKINDALNRVIGRLEDEVLRGVKRIKGLERLLREIQNENVDLRRESTEMEVEIHRLRLACGENHGEDKT